MAVTPQRDGADGDILSGIMAKSADHSATGEPEPLTDHSRAVRDAVRALARRIGLPGPLRAAPHFWTWAEDAGLLHDTGKIAEGYQRQIAPGGHAWGERHEVLSLAYVDLLVPPDDADRRLMTATGVLFHHRCLTGDDKRYCLAGLYPADLYETAEWEAKFGPNPDAGAGQPRVQVTRARHREFLAWLARQLGAEPQPSAGRLLWQRARDLFAEVHDAWIASVEPERGLLAVLLQGAVTLADHAGSAHVPFQTHMPLPRRFSDRLADPYPHQKAAAAVDGHLVLVAPTGSGKTEAALAWASAQLDLMPGQPRLTWVLPYRVSINAAVDRFRGRDEDSISRLDPAPGEDEPDIGLLHATTARTLLERAAAEDCPPGPADARAAAHAARARADAMRLFAQRVRVSTPHQLLRAAIAGPKYSSVLLEQANGLFVLDELHAYDPEVFGRLCAAMRLWEDLGGRVAVTSATLAEPMVELVRESLAGPVAVHRAPPGTAPDRHRLVLDDEPIDSPASLERLRRWITEGHAVLVVANKVRTAQYLYEKLAEAARTTHAGDPDAAILVHSRFTGRDRARHEQRIRRRYPERPATNKSGTRQGGLVVSTQVLEVSLCLDFDRGATEAAPIEAIAQRAGRVNRRGLHPDGPVEFRVHHTEDTLPYDAGAVQAAWDALHATSGTGNADAISEETVETWLRHAYDTAWGHEWVRQARKSLKEFAEGFLTFCPPFADRSEFAGKFDERFDGVDVLHAADVEEYGRRLDSPGNDRLLLADLLIPIRRGQWNILERAGCLQRRSRHCTCGRTMRCAHCLRVDITDAPYSPELGLDLTVAPREPEPVETIL